MYPTVIKPIDRYRQIAHSAERHALQVTWALGIAQQRIERLEDELTDLRAIVGPIKAGGSIMVFQPDDEAAELWFRTVIKLGVEGDSALAFLCDFYLRHCDDDCRGKGLKVA